MRNLFNYIIDIFLASIILFISLFFFIRGWYLVSVILFVCLLLYLIFSDIYFPSLGNINRFVFTAKKLRKKILLKILYLALYILIFCSAGYLTPYILILLNLSSGLDVIFLVIKKKRFFFYLFNVE